MATDKTTANPSGDMMRSVVNNQPIYSDGINRDLFNACCSPNGATLMQLRTMAAKHGTGLALRMEPLAKHSRPAGKRGYRWDVRINGKTVNGDHPLSLATLNALQPADVISIRNVRSTDNLYVDSNGFGKTDVRIAERAARAESDAKPTDAKPTDAKPTDAKPTDAKPKPTATAKPKPTATAKPKPTATAKRK